MALPSPFVSTCIARRCYIHRLPLLLASTAVAIFIASPVHVPLLFHPKEPAISPNQPANFQNQPPPNRPQPLFAPSMFRYLEI